MVRGGLPSKGERNGKPLCEAVGYRTRRGKSPFLTTKSQNQGGGKKAGGEELKVFLYASFSNQAWAEEQEKEGSESMNMRGRVLIGIGGKGPKTGEGGPNRPFRFILFHSAIGGVPVVETIGILEIFRRKLYLIVKGRDLRRKK